MHMSNENDKGSFWATIPGILTGLAALITAIVSFWLILSPFLIQDAPPEIVFQAPGNVTIGDSAIITWTVKNAE